MRLAFIALESACIACFAIGVAVTVVIAGVMWAVETVMGEVHMTARDFCYWLQGLFELGKPTELNAERTEIVKRHLAMVFVHEIDPSAGSAAHQAELGSIHAASQVTPKPSLASPSGGIVFRC